MLLKARETCVSPSCLPPEAIRSSLCGLQSLLLVLPFCTPSLSVMDLMEFQSHVVDSRDCVKREDIVHDLKAQVPPAPMPCLQVTKSTWKRPVGPGRGGVMVYTQGTGTVVSLLSDPSTS